MHIVYISEGLLVKFLFNLDDPIYKIDSAPPKNIQQTLEFQLWIWVILILYFWPQS